MPITAPTVNINGTSRDELLDQLHTAHMAIAEALTALAKTTPHGRDYQTVNLDVWAKATADHRRRMVALSDVQTEIFEIWNHVFNQEK